MKNRRNETYYMNRLIRVEKRGSSFTLDVDTERDGHWCIPDKGFDRIKGYLKEQCLRYWEMGMRSITVRKIPADRISGIVRGIGYILANYRCSHATLQDYGS